MRKFASGFVKTYGVGFFKPRPPRSVVFESRKISASLHLMREVAKINDF